MMERGKHGGSSEERNAPPERFASTNPPAATSGDYSLATLQTVMAMQETLGQLKQAVQTLTEQGKDHGKKLDRVSHIIYAAGVVLAIILCIGGWTLKIASDIAVSYFSTHQQATQPPVNFSK